MTLPDKTLKGLASGPFVKYVFRISSGLKEKVDSAFPPRQHGQSEFYREAITNFLRKEKQALADRPHLRGRENAYKKVCGLFSQSMLDAVKAAYPEVSVSVVIQAAVTSELKKPRYKMVSLPTGKLTSTDSTCNDQRQDTDDNQSARGATRELAPAFN